MASVADEVALTRRQAQVLRFIREYSAEHKRPPTHRDIGEHFGITVHGAFCHIRVLARHGFLTYEPNVARGIRLAGDPCPCCGGTGVAR